MKNEMRVALTKQMLKEGMLRVLAHKTLSKITISDLCTEAGINRATFYKHYESPTMVLKDIVTDHYIRLNKIYHEKADEENSSRKEGVLACLEYLDARKNDIKVLFSQNTENSISGFGLSLLSEHLSKNKESLPRISQGSEEDAFLCAIVISSAVYGLINVWMTMDIDKPPEEIMEILLGTLSGKYYISI